jgi:Uncharacterised nucleotidyltransferase
MPIDWCRISGTKVEVSRLMPPFPEQELLKACVRGALEPSLEDRISGLLEGDICWSRFLSLADRNDVLPLVYVSCSRFEEKIPRQVLASMGETSASIAAWNLTLAVELIAVLNELQKNGIAAVPFKGPVLVLAVYGQLGLRRCRDLDIFVKRDLVWAAVEVLRCRGYQMAPSLDASNAENIFLWSKDVTLENPATCVCIELHWAVCEPSFDVELHSAILWRRTQPLSLLGETLFIPSPEDLLFLLCIHGARHHWNCLKWLCDITQLIRIYSDLDWVCFLRTADRFRQRRAVWIAVRLAHELLDVSLPLAVQSLIQRDLGSFSPIEEHLFPNLLVPDESISQANESLFDSKVAAETDIKNKLARLRSKDRLADRLAFAFQLIRDFVRPDAGDLDTNQLRKKPACLFWIIQPVRLMQAHGLAFIFHTSRKLIAGLVR